MKTFRIMLVLALAVVALGVAPGASAGAFSYTSGIRVLNLSASDASVTLTFYNLNGGVNTSTTQPISGNGYYSFFPLNAVAAGFNGSVIVSSTTPIAATSNVLGYTGGVNVSGGSYTGASSGATTVYLPTLMKNNSGYNTWFNVQNAGNADADITVGYSDGAANSKMNLGAGASTTFDQATETHSATVFSAIVTSDQPVVITVIEENPSIIFAYNGFSSGSTTPYIPLVQENNAGWRTGMQIQNTGASNTDVTVTYTPRTVGGAGTTCTETHTIQAGKGAQFAFTAFSSTGVAGSTCTPGQKFIGNAKVTSNSANMPLVAIVNQLLSVAPQAKGGAYNSFDPATANSQVILPLIMDRNSGWYTGFNIQNVGSTSTTVNCTFTGGTGYTVSGTIAPGDTLGGTQLNQIANGYVGSGTCTASGGAENKIVGIVNQLKTTGNTDFFMVYNAITP